MWKSREVSLHRLFILFFIYSFSHTTWTQHSVFSMNSPASPHIPQSCSVQLHCFYVRYQLSSCGAAVRARVPAARDRSSSGPLGVSLVGLGHHFKPPWSTGDGDFFYLFFLTTARMWLFYVSPFFYFLFFTPVLRWSRRRFDFFFSVIIISLIICPPQCGIHLDRGWEEIHSFVFFRGNNMSRRKQTNPFKVDCRYSRYCLNTISRVTYPCHVQYSVCKQRGCAEILLLLLRAALTVFFRRFPWCPL